jgi:hypothetical protein
MEINAHFLPISFQSIATVDRQGIKKLINTVKIINCWREMIGQANCTNDFQATSRDKFPFKSFQFISFPVKRSYRFAIPDRMIYLIVGDAATQRKPLEKLGFGKPVLIEY